MTLKDFHDGSIPTDLPLPSALGGWLRLNRKKKRERERERERRLLPELEEGYLGLLA